jgi:hypothetical protein
MLYHTCFTTRLPICSRPNGKDALIVAISSPSRPQEVTALTLPSAPDGETGVKKVWQLSWMDDLH